MKAWPWYNYLILSILIFAVAFFLFFKPRNTELASLRTERIGVEQEVQTLRVKKQQLDQIEAELVTLAKTLKELEVIIPQKKEISDILRRIQQLAYDSRLNITKFAPMGEITKEFYAEWPIPIEITGNYHNLGIFFDRLSRFSRIFNVENFSIRALTEQTEGTTISSRFTAKTYYFLEDKPAATPPADQQGK